MRRVKDSHLARFDAFTVLARSDVTGRALICRPNTGLGDILRLGSLRAAEMEAYRLNTLHAGKGFRYEAMSIRKAQQISR